MGSSFVCHLLSPTVSSSDYSRALAKNAEFWTTSKMSPPPTIFKHHLIDKEISMSNQNHSLSPPCLVLKFQNPFICQLWIFTEFHTFINSPWVQTETQRIGSKPFKQWRQLFLVLSPHLSCYFSVLLASRIADLHLTSDLGIQLHSGGCSGPSSFIHCMNECKC